MNTSKIASKDYHEEQDTQLIKPSHINSILKNTKGKFLKDITWRNKSGTQHMMIPHKDDHEGNKMLKTKDQATKNYSSTQSRKQT